MNEKELNFISQILKSEITVIKHYNSRVYLVELNGLKYVLKINQKTNDARILERVLETLNFPFNNEYFFNIFLSQYNLTPFNKPKLIKYRHNKFMLFEYLPEEKNFENSLFNFRDWLNNYIEFHKLLYTPKTHLLHFKPFILLRNPEVLLLRTTFVSLFRLRIKEFFELQFFVFSLISNKLKLSKHYILHNDLNTNQNWILSDEKYYLIDFASIKITNKWILSDLITFIFDLEKLKLDNEKLLAYTNLIDEPNLEISKQIKFSLIVYLLPFLNSKRIKEFIFDTILDDLKFAEWSNIR